jgi:hypothetical protein
MIQMPPVRTVVALDREQALIHINSRALKPFCQNCLIQMATSLVNYTHV